MDMIICSLNDRIDIMIANKFIMHLEKIIKMKLSWAFSKL